MDGFVWGSAVVEMDLFVLVIRLCIWQLGRIRATL